MQAKLAVDSDQEVENKAKAKKGALFLAAVISAYLAYLIFSGEMGTFIAALKGVDTFWVWMAALCYLFYFIMGVVAYVTAVVNDPKCPVGIRDLMSVEASGTFFGNLTPMQAGSLPAEIIRLTRTGLDPGRAGATQFTRFIMFQLGVVLFAAVMLFARFSFFLKSYGDIVFLNLVVFGVHFVELVFLFVICLFPNFVKHIGRWGIRFAKRHHLIKDASHLRHLIDVEVGEFSDAFKRAATDKVDMLFTLIVTLIQLAFLYMIPWFVLRAFGHNADFISCIAAGSMVQMVSSAVPLPGGTGGAEGGFALFYGPLFGSAATAGYLVWRIVTFFAPTLLAVPLLGLRSTGGVSIYQRWQRLRKKHRGGILGHTPHISLKKKSLKQTVGKRSFRRSVGEVRVNPALLLKRSRQKQERIKQNNDQSTQNKEPVKAAAKAEITLEPKAEPKAEESSSQNEK